MKLTGAELLELSGALALREKRIKTLRLGGVSIDSRKCGKKDVFVAIKGERFDAHDFISDVFNRGVGAVVAEKKWFRKNKTKRSLNNKNLVLVDDTTLALGELARNYRRKFIIPVIAVGGSNGKTSTKDFIASVLETKYRVLKTEGNMNNAIGVPLTLFNLDKKHEICIIETGTNHFGEVAYLCGIAEPQFGVITNIGKEHLEFLKDLNGVLKAECELLEWLENNYGTFFLNADDTKLSSRVNRNKVSVFSYGSKAGADVKGKIKKFKGFYPEIQIKYQKQIINTKLNTIGSQSFHAAISAAAIGFYFDVTVSKIRKSLAALGNISSKRNGLVSANGFNVIDDTYNSNPDSAKIALENMQKYSTKGIKHVVLADMLELGKSSKKEHMETGRLVRKLGFKNLYTCGKESFNTFKAAKGVKNNYHFEDKESLIQFLLHTVKKNDLVLVKGSRSMKMEEVVQKLIADN